MAHTSGKECKGEVIGPESIKPIDLIEKNQKHIDDNCASKEDETIESVNINSHGDGGGGGDKLYCVDVYKTSDCSGASTFAQEYDAGDDLCACSTAISHEIILLTGFSDYWEQSQL